MTVKELFDMYDLFFVQYKALVFIEVVSLIFNFHIPGAFSLKNKAIYCISVILVQIQQS